MYKVVLVEDEAFVRMSIKNMLPWDEINLSFCGEASDGETALLLIQQVNPDIVITDIKMPFMDGLQLSRSIKGNMPNIKIVILSGHDEFDFAQEAIRIGVDEYILKPIRAEKLIDVLKRVVKRIESEKREKEGVEVLRKQLGDNLVFMRERFLNELSAGIILPSEAVEKALGMQIEIIAGYYAVMIVEFDMQKKVNINNCKTELERIDMLISGIINTHTGILSFRRSLHERVFILKGNNRTDLRQEADALADSIKNLFIENPEDLSLIFIGGIRERIQGIAESMSNADAAKDYRHVFKLDRIIDFEKVSLERPESVELMKFDRGLLSEFLNFGDSKGVEDFLDRLIGFMERSELESLLYIYYTYMDIVITTAKFINSLEGKAETIITELADLEKAVVNIQSFFDFKSRVRKILESALEFKENKKNNRLNELIVKTKKYIEEFYTDPDLSLITAASYVSVSPNYLSTIFSHDSGDTFSEYLTNVRVKKAKELLKTTSMRTSEIAYVVGYSNPHYFSFIFKKVTGVTTKEYRK